MDNKKCNFERKGSIMKEIWKDIDGYEGLYQVSNLGRIKVLAHTFKRYSSERILDFSKYDHKYISVNLYDGNKCHIVSLHSLVAQAFIPNPDNLPMINHKDENPSNNRADNLEWCTHRHNDSYGTKPARISAKLKALYESEEGQRIKNSISVSLKDYYLTEDGQKRKKIIGSQHSKENLSLESRKKMRESQKRYCQIHGNSFSGKHHSDGTREILRQAILGRRWMNDREVEVQVKSEDIEKYLNEGYVFGRLKRHKEV